MPATTGMCFVLVQHLDPNHKSLLVELLSRKTHILIAEARDGTRIQGDRIFVIPPNTTLTMRAGILRLSKPSLVRGPRRPIDTFFASLAEDQGERAVCIVLAGTGSDGSAGLVKIKEHGGLCLAQAAFDSTAMHGMPQSAAATGLVDHVAEVEDMPALLIDYQQHLRRVSNRKREDGTREDVELQLAEIGRLLRLGTGHDFGRYKRGTLLRRIQRRMQVLRIETVTEFIARLKREPQQVNLLFRDFLIGVTQFFRDPKMFETLERDVLPRLLKAKERDEPLRIWIPACATGEEVYSLAILVREAIVRDGIERPVQIFGTDIDDVAVSAARAARFALKLDGISPARIERWFARDGEHLCPIREIREMCVFSTHSVIKDPPFSRLDLISCRNLFIYLEPDLQDRVMRTFHYALRPDGYLCLGQSEGVARSIDLFRPVAHKHRIFQRREALGASPDYTMTANRARKPMPRAQPSGKGASESLEASVHRAIGRHLPAYVVIDQHQHVIRFSSGPIGKYLDPSPRSAGLKVLDILRKSLRAAVRTALTRARKSGRPVFNRLASVALAEGKRTINLIVEPIVDVSDTRSTRWVIAFIPAETAPREATRGKGAKRSQTQLERELAAVRVQMSATIEELESFSEESRSAKEEYQSVNEELQSSNEELETAKEEMQSVNEELQTINAELANKNELLVRVNDDLKNLLDSTEIATIFLHEDLRIKNFTPAMTQLFHLRLGDRGRPITELMSRMSYRDLARDVKEVLRTLQVVERQLSLTDGARTFLMRIRPYRSLTNVIDGVVITFVDVTDRERHALVSAQLAAIVESSQDGIVGHQFDGTITSWNLGAERIFGYAAEQAIGQRFDVFLSPERADLLTMTLKHVQRGRPIDQVELRGKRKDGTRLDLSLSISPVKDAQGEVIAASTIAREVTDRKLAEEHRELLMGELDHRVKNTLMVISSLISQTLRGTDSPAHFAEVIEGRIQSLSRVHNLLNSNLQAHAELHAIVSGELAPYGGGRREAVQISGPDRICLTGRATQAIALAIHELSTNASKFGALSTPSGIVTVGWRVDASRERMRLTIEWREAGGPEVRKPTRHGFGSQLIERVVKTELDADVQRSFLEDGLRCSIAFDLNAKTGYVIRPSTRVQ